MKRSGEERARGFYNALSFSSLGIEVAISIFVGFFAGHWLDQKWGTDPWLMLVFLGCGIAAAFRAIWRAGERMRQVAASENHATNGGTGSSDTRDDIKASNDN